MCRQKICSFSFSVRVAAKTLADSAFHSYTGFKQGAIDTKHSRCYRHQVIVDNAAAGMGICSAITFSMTE